MIDDETGTKGIEDDESKFWIIEEKKWKDMVAYAHLKLQI